MGYFFRRGGGKFLPDIVTGGPIFLHFNKCKMLSLLFLSPRGESKLHCQLRWGPWPDSPLGSATAGGDSVAVKMGVVQMEKVNDQMGQGRSVHRDDILILSGKPG